MQFQPHLYCCSQLEKFLEKKIGWRILYFIGVQVTKQVNNYRRKILKCSDEKYVMNMARLIDHPDTYLYMQSLSASKVLDNETFADTSHLEHMNETTNDRVLGNVISTVINILLRAV